MRIREKTLKEYEKQWKEMYEMLGTTTEFRELMLHIRRKNFDDILKVVLDNAISFQEWVNIVELMGYHYANNSILMVEKYPEYRQKEENKTDINE